MKQILVVLLLSIAAFTQAGKVLELDLADAKEAKSAYDDMTRANKRMADFNQRMREKYLVVKDGSDSAASNIATCLTGTANGCAYYRKGWENGFEYSDDFRFMVPSPYKPPTGVCGTWITPAWSWSSEAR